MYAQRNNETCSCSHCCSGKAIIITYSDSVFVASSIQHAIRMRLIVIFTCPALQHFSTISHEYYKKDIEQEMCVLIFSTTVSDTLLILRRIDRDMIKNVYWSSCSKYPLFLPGFN
jgi:hypothetical protein